MLTRFARLSTRHARAVVIAAVLVFAVAGAIGGGVADHLTSGGFEDPSSESSRAEEALAEEFDTGVPNLLLLVTAPGGDVDDPAVAAAGQALTEELAAEEGVADVVSYWSEGNASPLRNDDGSRALVVARVEGNDDQVEDRVTELAPRYERTAADGGVDIEVGGFAEVFHEVGDTIEEDLVRAEMIALPITLVLLILVFGSVVAASLPLVVGVMSIVGTFFVLRGLAALTDVSIYALNLTTALGLGLAIDYSLFVVSRYREELRAGHAPRVAATRTVRTAGRTVAFSALTVAASLCAMLVFPIAFVVVALLLVLGAPFLGLRLASPDDRVLPESADVRQVHDVIREEFSSEEAGALSVVVHDVRDADAPWDVLVTGQSASLVDTNQSLFDRLPWALGMVAVITAVLLFMMFGSVVIPAKAIVLNLLSLTATFGSMVWIFQDGNLSGLLDFTATGSLNAAMPILMFCVAFGLSMDYEVFLLSRIKEEHDNGHDNVSSVAVGLERTGRIVTAAAVIIAVVFIAFATSRVSFIKLFGVGLTLAVLLDAFLIRGTLVPAFMRLAGDWNWWAPGPLRRFHDRWGVSEHVDLGDGQAEDDSEVPPASGRDAGEVPAETAALAPR